jgi:integrase
VGGGKREVSLAASPASAKLTAIAWVKSTFANLVTAPEPKSTKASAESESDESLNAPDRVCVINGTARERHWSSAAARAELRRTAAAAGVRRRFAPHQLRHAHAVDMAREGVPLVVIQRQLGHSNLGITSVYLQGIDSGEIIETVWNARSRAGLAYL